MRNLQYESTVIVSFRYPLSSVTSSPLPSSGHDVFLCHPMWGEVGGQQGGHGGQTQRGNQSSLSLCDSISRLCTHEWTPRHLSSEPRNEPRRRKGFTEDQTGRVEWWGLGTHMHISTSRLFVNKNEKENDVLKVKVTNRVMCYRTIFKADFWKWQRENRSWPNVCHYVTDDRKSAV